MNIFYLLIGVSLLAALIFLAAFIWAVRTGQFDDNETPAMRVLFDDEPVEDHNGNQNTPSIGSGKDKKSDN
jgi:cbb3-type cytochrome oxidase maturation protein